ncbi:armadillo-type protein [Radiomyces spectabilis]|uniref:armadillo-type protein n=1 Tax=Radiomyces spectabilis TaxID=64574 RepID=UPI00221FBD15|nr:armadillo-type protein [Radiomyces spectabilis]KAI8377732.1 armadillo-type protein [Radiomyces spectabilis]
MAAMQHPDAASIHAQFEETCSDFQVPATRAAAEQILTSFRQIPQVLSVCRYILDHTQSPMVQFQVALAIGDVAMRDYLLYSLDDLTGLKTYLIEYCLQRPTLMKYVRVQLLRAVALITKRGLFDMADKEKEAIFLHVKYLLEMDNEPSQILGVSLAIELLDQFSSGKSLSVGLTWEFHYNSKVFFESHILLPLFQQLIGKLHTMIGSHQPQPDCVPPLLIEILTLLEKILQWDFEATNTTAVFSGSFAKAPDAADDFDREDGPTVVKKTYSLFPNTWQPVIGNAEVIWLFFMTYSVVQADEQLAHRCRQCLVQLAGFKQEFFNNDTAAIKNYATTMVHGILKMTSGILAGGNHIEGLAEQGPQMLGTIQMIRRLLENMPLPVLCSIPEFFQFLNEIGQLQLLSLQGTISDIDEGWIGEACDECLQTWVKLADVVQPSDLRGADPKAGLSQTEIQTLTQYMRNVAYQIVEAYIKTRLEYAKRSLEEDEEEEEDEITSGFKDWDTYADQLTCIGILGRLNPHQSLLILQQVLDERFTQLKAYFTTNVLDADHHLWVLHEQMHWITLVASHILADAGKGEQPMIPDSLMHLSGSQPLNEDQVVNLCKRFLEIFSFTSSFGANSIEASNCSPRVAETLIWFMERWSRSYLLIDENEYGFISPNIAKAFGRPGPSDGEGIYIVDFFIQQMKANFVLWNAEQDVLLQLVRWLDTCGNCTNLRNGLLQSNRYPELVRFVTENLDHLPVVIHNSLVQTITTISSGASDPNIRDTHLALIFGMIEERLGSVLHDPNFSQKFQQADVTNNLLNVLEMFDGLALASQFSNTAIIFTFCSKFFASFLQLMNIYRTVLEVQLALLQFFADLASRMDSGQLETGQKQTFYHIIIEMLRSFGAANQGKKRLHSQEEEADKPYADISVVLALLSNLMAFELEDFNHSTDNRAGSASHSDVADVILFGVNTVIPMIDLEILKIPAICQQYIKLISNLIEIFPDKLAGLPSELFNNLIASLEFGLRHDIDDIKILTLHAIAPLAMWTHKQGLDHANVDFIKPALSKFLSELLNLLCFQHVDMNIMDAAGDALVSLICVQKDTYMTLVNQIISQQPAEIQPRLLHAFEELDKVTTKDKLPTLQEASNFKEALLSFLMNVRAVLRVK